MPHAFRTGLAVAGLFTAAMLAGSPLYANSAGPEAGGAAVEPSVSLPVGMVSAKHRQFGPASSGGSGRAASLPTVLLQLEGRVGEQAEVRFRVQAKRKRLLVLEVRF